MSKKLIPNVLEWLSMRSFKFFFLMLVVCLCDFGATAQTLDTRPVFSVGGSRTAISAAYSQSAIDSLKQLVASGKKIQIVGTSSPDGTYQYNKMLAGRRAKMLLRQLRRLTHLSDSSFVLTGQVLSWKDLRNLVEQDENMPERDSVLSVLKTAEEQESSKEVGVQLRKISAGIPYLYIKQRLFPLMRTALVSSDGTEPQFSASQSLRVGEASVDKLVKSYRNKVKVHKGRVRTKEPMKTSGDASSTGAHSASSAFSSDSVVAGNVVADSAATIQNLDAGQMVKNADVHSHLWYWVAITGLLLCLLLVLFFGGRKLAEKDLALQSANDLIAKKDGQIATLNEELQKKRNKVSSSSRPRRG